MPDSRLSAVRQAQLTAGMTDNISVKDNINFLLIDS
jgi:hypothetical protein